MSALRQAKLYLLMCESGHEEWDAGGILQVELGPLPKQFSSPDPRTHGYYIACTKSLQIQSSEVDAFKTKLNPMRLVSLKKEIICKVLISKIYSKLTYPIKAK